MPVFAREIIEYSILRDKALICLSYFGGAP
jgi:hypothetical protein